MKNTTENTNVVPQKVADRGPVNVPGLTAREYREMQEEYSYERDAYLDYINDR